MKVCELIKILGYFPEDAEVRFASQPNWPFEYNIGEDIVMNDEENIVYLAEAGQIGYLPGDIAEKLSWK